MSSAAKIALFVSAISFAVGVGSLFFPDTSGAVSLSKVFLQLVSLFIIPLVTLFIAVSISQQGNEKNMERAETEIRQLKNEIQDSLSGVYQSPFYLTQIAADPNSGILTKFVPGFVSNLNRQIRELSAGHIWEYNPGNFHAFVKNVFGFATKTILATSIVDPKTFWETPEALEYLEFQGKLINRGIRIIRYFFIEESRKDEYLPVIGVNLARGIIVKVLIKESIPGPTKNIIKDGGLVDQTISISCIVDSKSGTITKVDCWVGAEDKIDENRVWLDVVKRFSRSLVDVYGQSDNEIRSKYQV